MSPGLPCGLLLREGWTLAVCSLERAGALLVGREAREQSPEGGWDPELAKWVSLSIRQALHLPTEPDSPVQEKNGSTGPVVGRL